MQESVLQQRINLYTLIPQTKKTFLTARNLVLYYGLFIAFLFLFFCTEIWSKHKQILKTQILNTQITEAQKKLSDIKSQYPMLDVNDIQNSVKQLEKQVEEKNKIFKLLSINANFSTYFLGLSKASLPGLWLSNIQFITEDQQLIMRGFATQSNLVQEFMNNLIQQPEFSTLHFELQEFKQISVKDKDILFSFIITSKVS